MLLVLGNSSIVRLLIYSVLQGALSLGSLYHAQPWYTAHAWARHSCWCMSTGFMYVQEVTWAQWVQAGGDDRASAQFGVWQPSTMKWIKTWHVFLSVCLFSTLSRSIGDDLLLHFHKSCVTLCQGPNTLLKQLQQHLPLQLQMTMSPIYQFEMQTFCEQLW